MSDQGINEAESRDSEGSRCRKFNVPGFRAMRSRGRKRGGNADDGLRRALDGCSETPGSELGGRDAVPKTRNLGRLLSFSMTALLFVAVPGSSSLQAGGPSYVEYYTGLFARWIPAQGVPYTIDNGPLSVNPRTKSVIYDREQGAEIVIKAAESWNKVSHSALSLKDEGFLVKDFSGKDVNPITGALTGLPSGNPIIFDADGSITELFGGGTGGVVLGFAGIRQISADGTQFLSGWMVLNGQAASLESDSERKMFLQTVAHEFGHLLGLDHSLGLPENWVERGSFGRHVPLMFPIGQDASLSEIPVTDDQSWLAWLYPTDDFASETATIRGRVARIRPGGPALQGANVTAMPAVWSSTTGQWTPGRENVTTCVTDFLTRGTGEFELPGLAPGCYFVRLDPIPRHISNIEITAGSNIGPFETDERPANIEREFYDLNESSKDDPKVGEVICLSAGEVLEGVEIVANEPSANFVQLTRTQTPVDLQMSDDDVRLVIFPDNFTFPFFGNVYREVFVNSDGNLTFGAGDARPGEFRTLDRMLAGPPRIAPLFTDLDPGSGGAVTVESGAGWVRFAWTEVPEWNALAPNTFSVTLFSNGGIRFEYRQVNVTPDPDDSFPQEGLHSVVGVTPGGSSAGLAVDFRQTPTQQLGGTAVYEVFPDQSFDLGGRVIQFSTAYSELYFPLVLGDAVEFTGIALSAFGDESVDVLAELRGDDGSVLSFRDNPTEAQQVEGRAQIAKLSREWFGTGSTEHKGWARFRLSSPQVGGFSQIANGLIGQLSYMDGSAAVTNLSSRLYFTRIYHGPAVYPTYAQFQDAETYLAIVNPGDEPADVTLRLYSAFGQPVYQVNQTIAPNGRLYGDLEELFRLSPDSRFSDGSVEVVSSGPGLAGFEWIRLPDTVIGLNAATDFSAEVLYSAQLGHSQDIFTNLKLVNTTAETKLVTVTAYLVDDKGRSSGPMFEQFPLQPQMFFQQNVEALFGLGPGGSQIITGSIKVEVTGGGVVGDVLFGDPQQARYAAALPLQTQRFREAVFSHISNGVDGQRRWLNSFTGLALFNPNAAQAQVTVRVYRHDGSPVGSKVVIMPANGRVSKTLVELVKESKGQMGGYIRLESTLPVVAQELFGNLDLDFLSAVVPARVP